MPNKVDSAIKANQSLQIIESHYKMGEYVKAKSALEKFRIEFPKYDLFITGPMIDIGLQLNDTLLIENAIEIFEKTPHDKISPHFLYNAGNGYHILYQLKIMSGVSIFECHSLIEKALECFNKSAVGRPPALTNLGNLYDEIGRPIEALERYEQALKLDSNFAMAVGNKALALRKLAPISNYETGYLIYAFQLYSEALDNPSSLAAEGGSQANSVFVKDKTYIEEIFQKQGKVDFLNKDLTHPKPNLSKLSKFVRFYTTYCLEKNLYLNLHLYSSVSDASVGDSIGVHLITKTSKSYSKEKKHVDEIAFRLNEIKEAFMTARLALVQSQYATKDYSNISEQTLIINNLDYSVSNIYVGYLKMAFKEGFSVLDKIAIFINHYLDLNFNENDRRLGYSSIWYSNLDKNNKINPAIEKYGSALYGIYSLFGEIRSSELDEIRNAVTHRYLRIYRHMLGPEESYQFEEMVDKTEELLFKVKCAIVYLNNFINVTEATKKKKSGKGFIPEMKLETNQWLDLWG
jgi:hypothetical protein